MVNNQESTANANLMGSSTNTSNPLLQSIASTEETNDSLSDEESDSESKDSEDGFLATKKYKQPVALQATNISIGEWVLNPPGVDEKELFSLEVKFLFGRRKIKYEMRMLMKPKVVMVMEYTFSQITGVQVKPNERTVVVQLSKRPNFTIKERGRCSKVPDFTDGNASTYQTHCIHVAAQNFEETIDQLLNCDKRLKQLERNAPIPLNAIFATTKSGSTYPAPPCDWDGENSAVFHCQECNSNLCSVCDDVLHRNSNKKTHKRVAIEVVRPTKSKDSKKRKKSETCRCGTGATKGTLGEPCTGNRCPCFSAGKGCSGCGCKNCNNPLKKPRSDPSSPTQPQHYAFQGADLRNIAVPNVM